MVNKSLEKRGAKLTKQPAKRVKEVACKEPKPLQAKSSVKEAGEKDQILSHRSIAGRIR